MRREPLRFGVTVRRVPARQQTRSLAALRHFLDNLKVATATLTARPGGDGGTHWQAKLRPVTQAIRGGGGGPSGSARRPGGPGGLARAGPRPR